MEETDRPRMGAFERGVSSFDILTVVTVDKGVVGIFADQFDEGIEFGFGEFLLVFNDEKILITEQRALGEVGFGGIKIVFVMIEAQNGCPSICASRWA